MGVVVSLDSHGLPTGHQNCINDLVRVLLYDMENVSMTSRQSDTIQWRRWEDEGLLLQKALFILRIVFRPCRFYYKTTAQIAEVEPRNYTINLLRLSRKETFSQGPAQDDAAQRGHLPGAGLPGVEEPQFLYPIGAYLAYDKMPWPLTRD